MNQLDVDKLFQKRFYAFFIDSVFSFVFIVIFSSSIATFNKDLDFLLSFLITIIFPLIVYFNIVPLITGGKTIGLYLTKLKLVHYKNRNILMKFIVSFFRSFYSILTLYMFRVFTINTMNNLGQLNFDKRCNMSIIQEDVKFNIELPEVNYRVSHDPIVSIQYFVVVLFIIFLFVSIFDFIKDYIMAEVFIGIIGLGIFLVLVFKNKNFKNQINSTHFTSKGDVDSSSPDSSGDGD